MKNYFRLLSFPGWKAILDFSLFQDKEYFRLLSISRWKTTLDYSLSKMKNQLMQTVLDCSLFQDEELFWTVLCSRMKNYIGLFSVPGWRTTSRTSSSKPRKSTSSLVCSSLSPSPCSTACTGATTWPGNRRNRSFPLSPSPPSPLFPCPSREKTEQKSCCF